MRQVAPKRAKSLQHEATKKESDQDRHCDLAPQSLWSLPDSFRETTVSSAHRLTTARLDTTRAVNQDVWISDNDGSRGRGRLLARIGRCGTKLFYFRGSHHGHSYIIPLGPYNRIAQEGYLTLEQAREQARHYGAILRGGHLKKPSRAVLLTPEPQPSVLPAVDAPAPPGTTLMDLCQAYVEFLGKCRRPSSCQNARTDVRNYIATCRLGNIPANQLLTKDFVNLLRSIRERSSADKANRIRALLLGSFNLGLRAAHDPGVSEDLQRFELTVNPISSIKKLEAAIKPLSRTLSAPELGHLWRLLNEVSDSNAVKYRAVRCTLLLGGQRCTQLLEVRTSDVNTADRTLTLFDSKGRPGKPPRVHVLPMSFLVWSEIEPLLREAIALHGAFLFPGNRINFPIGTDVISHAVEDLSRILMSAGKIQEPFCYRDFRRTIETRMSSLGIAKEVRAQIQSHDTGGVQMKHYNRDDFLPQKRTALDKWQRYVIKCAEAVEPSTHFCGSSTTTPAKGTGSAGSTLHDATHSL